MGEDREGNGDPNMEAPQVRVILQPFYYIIVNQAKSQFQLLMLK